MVAGALFLDGFEGLRCDSGEAAGEVELLRVKIEGSGRVSNVEGGETLWSYRLLRRSVRSSLLIVFLQVTLLPVSLLPHPHSLSLSLTGFPSLPPSLPLSLPLCSGQHNDARMNLAIALTAAREGATVANHVAAVGLIKVQYMYIHVLMRHEMRRKKQASKVK